MMLNMMMMMINITMFGRSFLFHSFFCVLNNILTTLPIGNIGDILCLCENILSLDHQQCSPKVSHWFPTWQHCIKGSLRNASCSLFIYYNQSFFRRIFIPGEGVCYCAKRKSQRVKADFLKAHFHQFACLVFLLQIIWFLSFITVLISVNIFCPSSEIG